MNIDNRDCQIAFGNFIKEGREKKSIFQQDIADRLGISQPYYSAIERGERNVDLILAMRICKELGLNMNKFLRQYMNK